MQTQKHQEQGFTKGFKGHFESNLAHSVKFQGNKLQQNLAIGYWEKAITCGPVKGQVDR